MARDECGTPGCPCFYARRTYRTGRPAVRADDLEVEVVLARWAEPGIGRWLSHHDKYRVWLELEQRGLSARLIALCLGMAPRSIGRWRTAARTLENA